MFIDSFENALKSMPAEILCGEITAFSDKKRMITYKLPIGYSSHAQAQFIAITKMHSIKDLKGIVWFTDGSWILRRKPELPNYLKKESKNVKKQCYVKKAIYWFFGLNRSAS